jgi:hypothetical protein
MLQSKKLVAFMNIMCVKNNKAIFYVFLSISSLKIVNFTKMKFSSLKILRKRREKFKIHGSFHPSVSSPCVPTQDAHILLHRTLTSELLYLYTKDQYNIT